MHFLTPGYVRWDGTKYLTDDNVRIVGTMGGDLSGTYPAPVVIGIQGRPIANIAPNSGDLLTWSSIRSQWEPAANVGGALLNYLALAANKTISSAELTVFIAVDTSGARAITLPPANGVPAGRQYFIVDSTGNANVNGVTITVSGSDTIDGVPYIKINSMFGGYQLVSNGVNRWRAISNQEPFLGSISYGQIPATSGTINLSNNSTMKVRNSTNSGDLSVFNIATNSMHFGDVSSTMFLDAGTINITALNANGVVRTTLGTGTLSVGNVVNTDISASAGIVYSKLSLTGSIVNADVSGSAAIAGTKITPAFGTQNISTTGSANVGNLTSGGNNLGSTFVGAVSMTAQRTMTANMTLDQSSTKDYLIEVNTTSSPLTLTLTFPGANLGREITIKDIAGTFGTNQLHIARYSNEMIDGVAADRYLMAPGATITYHCDGTNWWSK